MNNTNLYHVKNQEGTSANGIVPAISWAFLRQPALRWAAAVWLLLWLLTPLRVLAASTINTPGNLTVLEDALATNAFNGIGGTAPIVVAASSSDTNIINLITVNYTSPDTNGTVVFRPVTNAVGSATITLTVSDGDAITNTATFTVTVSEINDAPSFAFSTNSVVVNEDAGTQSIADFATNIVLGPSSESSQTASFTVTTTPTNLFAVLPAIAANGTLTFTWLTNKFGTNTVTVRLSDGGGTANGGVDKATNTFTLIAASVNDAPVLAGLSNSIAILEDGKWTNAFVASDVDNATWTLTASSSNTNAVKASISGSGSNRNLLLTTVANATNSATVSVVLSDGSLAVTNDLEVTITPVNDAPVASITNKIVLLEDSGVYTNNFTVSDIDTDVTNITLTVSIGDTNLVAASNLVLSGTATNRSLKITPATNAFGTNIITLIANDGTSTSTNAINFILTPVNDQPSFELATNLFVIGESLTVVTSTFPGIVGSVNLGPTNEASQTYVYTLTTSSNAFFKTLPTLATNGTLSFAVKTNVSGFVSARVVLKDKGGTSNGGRDVYTNTLYIAVTNINNAPAIAGAVDRTIYEDQPTNMNLTVSDADNANLQVTATSGNTGLLNVSLSGSGTSRVLRLSPVANKNGGPVTVTVKSSDGVLSATNTFNVTISPVNDAPSFTVSAATLTVAEDSGASSVDDFLASPSLGPSDEGAQTFTYSVTAAQTNFFSVQPAIATNGLLTFTLAADKFGTNLLTVRMVDNGGTANKGISTATNTFRLIVTNVNDAPTIGTIAAKTLNEDFGRTNLTFTVADIDTTLTNLTVSTTLSTNILTAAVSGTGATRTLTLTSVTNKHGACTITNIVSDGALTATNTVAITISPVNDAPYVDMTWQTNIVLYEDFGSKSYNNATNGLILVQDVDTDVTNLTVTVYVANTNLASATLTQNPNPLWWTLNLTSVEDAVGLTTVNVVADDGAKKFTNSVTLTLKAVNDPPSFSLSTNTVVVAEDAGAQSITNFAISLSAGPTNESAQKLTFKIEVSDTSFFSKQPAISSAGVLTFTTATNKFGTNSFLVYATDNGGTNSSIGDNNISESFEIFTLKVANVNDAPMIPTLTSKTIFEDCGATNLSFKVVDGDSALTNVTVSATCSKTNLATVTATRNGTNFYVTVTPTANTNSTLLGSAAISIVAGDGSLNATNSFMLSVTAVNDPPSFDLTTNSVTATSFLATHTISGLLTNLAAGPTSDEASQTMTASVSVDNPAFFTATPTLTTNGVLTFKTSTNSGTAVLTIKLKDNGGTANKGVAESAGQTLNVVIPSSPFTALSGDYNGLFFETNGVNHDRSGFVRFNVNHVGTYSGYLLMAGLSNKFAGQFALDDGTSSVTISNATINVKMEVSLDLSTNDTETITGTVTNSSWQTELVAVRSLYGTTNVVNEVGDYTLVLPGASNPATAPGGDGIAWVTVDDNGLISMVGLMGDGTSVSQQVGISKYGEWPLYAPLYQKGTNGSILSWVTFNLTNQYSVIESNALVWTKKAAAAGSNYTSGFTLSSYPMVSVYNPWMDLGISSGTVILSGGNLAAPVTNTVTVTYDTVVADSSPASKLALTLNPANGYITGSFVDTSRNATNLIYAVMLQQTNVARGFFLGTNQSGSFLLK